MQVRGEGIQHRLFVHLWDLRRVGWADHGYSREREPRWPLLDVRWEIQSRLEISLDSVPVLIDMVWYVIETLICRSSGWS